MWSLITYLIPIFLFLDHSNTQDIQCSANGLFADPTNPRGYYRCQEVGGTFYTYKFTCPGIACFDEKQQLCILNSCPAPSTPTPSTTTTTEATPPPTEDPLLQFTCTPGGYLQNPDDWMSNSTVPTCSVPFEDLLQARFVDGNSPRVENSFPSWINIDLLRRGQLFAQNNWYSYGLAAALGRAANMNNADTRDVAMFTKTMSSSPQGCARILASFGAKTMTWFQDLLFDSPSSPEISDFLQSVNLIRWIHIKLARDIVAKRRLSGNPDVVDPSTYADFTPSKIWDAFNTDLANSDIPLEQRQPPPIVYSGDLSIPLFNQYSISYFQFNAFVYPIIMGDVFGIDINASDEDLWAFNHLVAVIGYTFGLDDKYNMALQSDLAKAKEYYWKVQREIVIPSFFHIDIRTKMTIENILEGTRINAPAWSLQLYLYRVLTMIVGVKAPTLYQLFTGDDHYHEDNLINSVLPSILSDEGYRKETNLNSTLDLINVGTMYYGNSYTTQYGRARYSFLTPIQNE